MTIIPITKLRNFYNSLAKLGLSTETQLRILKDINREDKYKRLISLYEESKKDFSEYKNIDEPFLPSKLDHRKSLPVFEEIKTISTTHDVISVLQKRNPKSKVGGSDYNFEYIQREVPTYRITNTKSKAGRKSGAGGIDFIGLSCNEDDKLPILGEIKVAGDQNAFYALIQLLTYLSELYTPNQIERIKERKLFGNDYNFMPSTSFYLYILLVITNMGNEKEALLRETKTLAARMEKDIQEIKKIVFLKMDPKEKTISKI